MLSGDLPTLLVENFAHWLNLGNHEIELRPLKTLWDSSIDNWRISFSTSDTSWMRKGDITLIDIRSPTMRMLSSHLAPLESLGYLHVTHSPNSPLVVDLPRFKLMFYLNKEQRLESQNMPGMLVDLNQSLGTMFGLSNQLVLCSIEDSELLRSRRVIIPFGAVSFQMSHHHVDISIDISSQNKVRYQEYTIDTILRRLVGNGSLLSRLYKIYLHAVSAHCLPDPLTGRTGTQEALYELRSASCISFQKLTILEARLLKEICSLTPWREFRPAHLRIMESVQWLPISCIAQHRDFFTAAETIVKYARRLQAFPGGLKSQPEIKFPDVSPESCYLMDRAACRCAVLSSSELSSLSLSSGNDKIHKSRDSGADQSLSDDQLFTFRVSSMVFHWPQRLSTTTGLFKTLSEWTTLSSTPMSLRYSSQWLDRDLAATWITFYNLLRQTDKDSNFELIFSISSMAYSCPATRDIIPTLLAFATCQPFRTLDPPAWECYNLSEGLQPDRGALLEMAHSMAIKFESSPEFTQEAYVWEDEASVKQRRYSTFKARLESQVQEIVNYLIHQWPCEELHAPGQPTDRYD